MLFFFFQFSLFEFFSERKDKLVCIPNRGLTANPWVGLCFEVTGSKNSDEPKMSGIASVTMDFDHMYKAEMTASTKLKIRKINIKGWYHKLRINALRDILNSGFVKRVRFRYALELVNYFDLTCDGEFERITNNKWKIRQYSKFNVKAEDSVWEYFKSHSKVWPIL